MEMKEKNDIIYCGLCNKNINLEDEFAEFIHYRKKKDIISTVFYHVYCFRKRLQGDYEIEALKSQAKRILNMAEERLS